MKTIVLAAAAATLAFALNTAPALADGPRASSSNAVFQTAEPRSPSSQPAMSHYEWQYHYVGRHARLEGHWVLLR